MDSTELLGFLLGISVAIIGVLVTALGLSLRRNGKNSNHNPNLQTIEVLIKQNGENLGAMRHQLEGIGKTLVLLENTISFCPTVQSHRGVRMEGGD